MSTYAATANHTAHPSTRRRAGRVALWVLQIALAVAILGAGASKILGATAMVQLFDAIGVGQWFRYVTGALEVTGALLLLVPALAGLGALLLVGVMSGALLADVVILNKAPVALPFLLGLLIVSWARRAEIGAWVRRLRG
jgi:putative oxidoreductase